MLLLPSRFEYEYNCKVLYSTSDLNLGFNFKGFGVILMKVTVI